MENSTPALHYAHRAKPFSSELELTLTEHDLLAERGRSHQNFPLARLERIRLSFSPRNTARRAFVCELRAEDGRSVKFDNISWKSLIETERRDPEYRALIFALVERATRANRSITLVAGIAPLRFRAMQIIGFGFVAALCAAAAVALSHASYVVALASLGLGGYLVLWLREFLTRNQPRDFTPDSMPEAVLPPG